MRKSVVIVLLTLLFYNSVGYYIFLNIQRLLNEIEIARSIEEELYSEEHLTLFKIPINEYLNNQDQDFSRVEGDFEYDGKFYERVKEKIENDTLFIYCINNEREDKLLDLLSKHLNDHLFDSKEGRSTKSQKSIKDLLKDYLPKTHLSLRPLLTHDGKAQKFLLINKRLTSLSPSIPNPPPELI